MSSERSLAIAMCIVAVMALPAGCASSLTQIDPVVIALDRSATARPDFFTRVVATVEAQGYEPVVVQPSRGRLGVVARYTDRDDEYRIAVEVLPDARVLLTPIGARVEPYDGTYILPRRLEEEMAELAGALQRSVR